MTPEVSPTTCAGCDRSLTEPVPIWPFALYPQHHTARSLVNTQVSQLDKIKVVEYLRNGVRICQTSEVNIEAANILRKLGVPHPPKLHYVTSV